MLVFWQYQMTMQMQMTMLDHTAYSSVGDIHAGLSSINLHWFKMNRLLQLFKWRKKIGIVALHQWNNNDFYVQQWVDFYYHCRKIHNSVPVVMGVFESTVHFAGNCTMKVQIDAKAEWEF